MSFCTACGHEARGAASYCSRCGTRLRAAPGGQDGPGGLGVPGVQDVAGEPAAQGPPARPLPGAGLPGRLSAEPNAAGLGLVPPAAPPGPGIPAGQPGEQDPLAGVGVGPEGSGLLGLGGPAGSPSEQDPLAGFGAGPGRAGLPGLDRPAGEPTEPGASAWHGFDPAGPATSPSADPPARAVDLTAGALPPGALQSPRFGPRRPVKAIAAVAVIVVLAAGAAAFWLLSGGRPHHSAGAGRQLTGASPRVQGGSAQQSPPSPAAQSSAPAASSPEPVTPASTAAPSPSSPVSPAAGGIQVALAPGVAQEPGAAAAAAFLGRYFTAINRHDFAQYASLLGPQLRQGLTAGQFSAGYRSTTDSAATLTGVTPAAAGDLAAAVTFTSRQQAVDSSDHSTCTNWNITLFLVPQGSGYVMAPPPSGYHASSQPCV
jgi:hypothetical protein